MSAAASPRGKATATTDVDSIMPLLFATIGNPAISFRKMAAMDPENRTQASLEHKFRKWRQTGREIAEKNPEHGGTFTATTPKKPRAPAVKKGVNGRNKGKQSDVGDEEGAVDSEEEEGPAAVKLEGNQNSAADGNNNNNNNNNGSSKNKRSVSIDGENPAKKTKVTKKGTAKVVKKAAAKAREVGDDGDGSAQEEEVEPVPPKAKSRVKAAPKPKAGANTGKKVGDEEDGSAREEEVEPVPPKAKSRVKAAPKPKAGANIGKKVGDDEDGSAQEEEVEPVPPKAKSRVKAAPKPKAGANTGKKPTVSKSKSEVATEQGRIALYSADEVTDAEVDPVEGDGMDGLVPLEFEQEA